MLCGRIFRRIWTKDLKTQEENETVLEKKLEKLSKEYDALVAQIAGSGYDQIATRKKDVQELLGQLNHSVQRWEQTSKDLKKWCDLDITPNTVKYHIKNILQKTGYQNTLQLVAEVVEKRLILPKY